MIYYEKSGKGFPVILIHGFPNDHTTWDNIIPELQKKYKLLLPDLPGFGKSDLITTHLGMEDMACMIKDILDQEQIKRAIFVGHSMGGYVAMNFAKLFPEMIAGMSLVHSSASSDNEEKRKNREKAIVLMQKGDLEKKAFLRGMAQNLFSADFKKSHPEIVQSIIDNGTKVSASALSTAYNAIKNRQDKTDVLQIAGFPLQWIIGNEDTATSMTEMLQQAHIAKVNDVVIYESCGHMSMLENPEKLIADLIRFFDFVVPAFH